MLLNYNYCLQTALRSDESTSSAEELSKTMEKLTLDESYFLSPSETVSTTSSENTRMSKTHNELGQRFRLNAFLEECQLKPIERPWLDWDKASERTRERYVERSAEIVSSVLEVVYPGAAVNLWHELKTSSKVSDLLGTSTTTSSSVTSQNKFLEALAEAYKIADGWDAQRQVLSIIAGAVSFPEVLEYIPGLTRYYYDAADEHRQEHAQEYLSPKKMLHAYE